MNYLALDVLDKALAVVLGDKSKLVVDLPKQAKPKTVAESRKRIDRNIDAARKLYRQSRPSTGSGRSKAAKIPDALTKLIDQLKQKVQDITDDLESGDITASAWADDMADALATYYTAARMAGTGTEDIGEAALDDVARRVAVQAEFLKNFEIEIQEAGEFMAGWNARAESYADGIKAPYWDGVTDVLPLPAMPGEGTQCLNNCNCAWRIEVIDAEAGDYDCFWEWEEDSEHCQTCTERHEQWYPLSIRDFELQ